MSMSSLASTSAEEEVNLDVLRCPELWVERMFARYLSGEDIKNFRSVSKGWNQFVLQKIFARQGIIKEFRKRIDRNWRLNRYTSETVTYLIDHPGEIGAVSQFNICIKSYESTPLEAVRISIFNTREGSIWEIPGPFLTCIMYGDRKYDVVMSDKFLAIKVKMLFPFNGYTLLVWRISDKTKIVDQHIMDIKDFYISPNDQAKDILVLHTRYLEIWDFSDPDQISKVTTLEPVPAPSVNTSYYYPWITQLTHNPLSERMVTVWRHDKNPIKIKKHLEIASVNNYCHVDGNHEVVRVSDIIYLGGCFLMSCKVSLFGPHLIDCLSVKVVKDDGAIVGEYFFPEYNPRADCTWFPFNNNMIISVEDDVFLFKQKISNLGSPKKFEPIEMLRIPELSARNELTFEMFQSTSSNVFSSLDGLTFLQIDQLNYFNHL